MNKKQFWVNFFAASCGNLFEHYDKALFGFLAPFLAPLFFKDLDPIFALISTYAIMPLGLLSRPLGAFVFGKIGDRRGRKIALSFTLSGMALTTFSMGFLPTAQTIGPFAPLLLAAFRLLQNFFASGETTGGALLILESCSPKKRNFFSSLYGCSTIFGIILASSAIAFLASLQLVETHWRFLYWIGGITGLLSLIVRLFAKEPHTSHQTSSLPLLPLLWKYRRIFLTIVFTTGFSYANYHMVTSMMNGYIPLITSLSKTQTIQMNSSLLIYDLLLLPLIGIIGLRFSHEKIRAACVIALALFSFPLYSLLSGATYWGIMTIRLLFVTLGVGFSASLYAWLQEITPKEHRYTLIALGIAIGSQLIGGGACFCSLYLYQLTNMAGAPALYLVPCALLATFALKVPSASRRRVDQSSFEQM